MTDEGAVTFCLRLEQSRIIEVTVCIKDHFRQLIKTCNHLLLLLQGLVESLLHGGLPFATVITVHPKIIWGHRSRRLIVDSEGDSPPASPVHCTL